jgi:hypothetical protein
MTTSLSSDSESAAGLSPAPLRSAERSIVAPQELRLFKIPHISIVEHYEATRCWEEPDTVVQEFLEILTQPSNLS